MQKAKKLTQPLPEWKRNRTSKKGKAVPKKTFGARNPERRALRIEVLS